MLVDLLRAASFNGTKKFGSKMENLNQLRLDLSLSRRSGGLTT